MFKTLTALSFLCLLSCNIGSQQKIKEANTIYIPNTFIEDYSRLNNRIKGNNLVDVAKVFIDSTYVAKTLEVGTDSAPVINLREFDCLTLVESSVAFQKSNGNNNDFIKWIELLRYRNGKALGYTSRLHYFSDWIADNVKKQIVEDITCDIGGDTIQFSVDFMSTHPQYYPQLNEDSSLVAEMQKIEQQINEQSYCYIPKDRLTNVESKIKDGDILGITTNIKGLDFAHNGLAIWQNGRLHMLHASSEHKKVMITIEPLAEYLLKKKHMTGVCVLRLQ